eukprot:CAMPEP_0184685200 /NCGR_PEP_ID=MMETSP0312-20130426/18105_1 /TAXON_ID=31354 /ORGANISM="Compsopogon coeruleus, Strain SAG 36.94" /LENGTH=432 /DNA_ID=CAMNT_0027139061 /DNA_START=284 /DNA_END=1583 /DNA_ORIENTATION=+
MGKLKATNRKFVEELLALKREEMRLVQQELSALEALGSSATSGDDTSEDEYLESSSRRRSQSFQLAPRDPQNRDSSSLTRTQSFSQSVSTTSAGESTPSNLPGKRNTIEEHNDILRKSYSQLEREYFSLRRQLRTMGEPNSPASYDQEVELKSVSRQLEREMERARHLNSLLDESKRERNQAEVELRNERTRLALLRRALQREEESRKVLEVENARYHQMFYSSQSKNGRELGRERSLGCLDQTAHPRLRPAFASYHEEEIPFFSTDSVHVIEPPIGVPPPPAPRRTHRPSARSTGLRRVNTTVRFTMRGEEAIRGGSDKSYMNPNGNDDVENIPSILELEANRCYPVSSPDGPRNFLTEVRQGRVHERAVRLFVTKFQGKETQDVSSRKPPKTVAGETERGWSLMRYSDRPTSYCPYPARKSLLQLSLCSS